MHTHIHTLTPRVSVRLANLCMFSENGIKTENPAENDVGTWMKPMQKKSQALAAVRRQCYPLHHHASHHPLYFCQITLE